MSDEKDEAAEVDPNASVTIQLRTPITVGSQTHTEITLRPVKGKDMRYMVVDDKRPVAAVMWMAGRLSGLTQQVTDELLGVDLKAVTDAVNTFLAGTPETGAPSSDT